MPVVYTKSRKEALVRQRIYEEMQRRQRAEALRKATIEVEKRMMNTPEPQQETINSSEEHEMEKMTDLLNGASLAKEIDETVYKDTENRSNDVIFPSLLPKDAEKRLLQAYTRIETVERGLDRKLISAKNKVAEQDLMIHILIERLEQLEEKVYLTRTGLVYKPKRKPTTKYSPLVADRATQTKSEYHNVEGVYVMVARGNQTKNRKVVSRTPSYAQPDRKLDEEKIIYLPSVYEVRRKMGTADSFNNTL